MAAEITATGARSAGRILRPSFPADPAMTLPLALTFDLDDTLWPIAPTIARAETLAQNWFAEHAPRVLETFDPGARMALRERIVADHPDRTHDLGWIRHRLFARMLERCGYDPALADVLFPLFLAARQQVALYEDAQAALEWLSARYPLAAISNGNADLKQIGLGHHFAFSLSATDYGAAKPDPGIYHEACRRLGCAPAQVLHVGDDPHTDVYGARNAGLRSAWLNRTGESWRGEHAPHHEFADLRALVQMLRALEAPR